jgi:putative FmdB family regulatory protein
MLDVMATYEYVCRECNIQKIDSRSIMDPEPKINCESCGRLMTKVYSVGAVTFNGSGFYSKDK